LRTIVRVTLFLLLLLSCSHEDRRGATTPVVQPQGQPSQLPWQHDQGIQLEVGRVKNGSPVSLEGIVAEEDCISPTYGASQFPNGGFVLFVGDIGWWYENVQVFIEVARNSDALRPIGVRCFLVTDIAPGMKPIDASGRVRIDASARGESIRCELDLQAGRHHVVGTFSLVPDLQASLVADRIAVAASGIEARGHSSR